MGKIRAVLSENIKKYRLLNDLSQEELAYRCGLHRTYISDVERCMRNISIDNIEKIAAALGVRSSELLNEESACISKKNT